jgi:hypothetical protein
MKTSQWTTAIGLILALLITGEHQLLKGENKPKTTESSGGFSGTDRGSFKIYSDGQLVGRESFQISSDSTNYKATGETLLSLERMKEKVTFNIKSTLQFARNLDPLSYQVVQEAGSNIVRAGVKFKSPSSDVTYEIGKEIDRRTIELQRDVLVLDDNVYHHYILLARRFDYQKGGEQQFTAFIPQQFLAGNVTIADKGNELVDLAGTKILLQHLLVDTGDLQISIWVDPSHSLKKISVPQSKVDVVRE